jgi:hypothetical protein
LPNIAVSTPVTGDNTCPFPEDLQAISWREQPGRCPRGRHLQLSPVLTGFVAADSIADRSDMQTKFHEFFSSAIAARR